ncbi:MAG: zinc-dependent alcohol dehydrogenase family protein [Oxalobacter sp.]|nr:zinc-dependent alcohol dehydrogenase family protein [Oxalobacter sp.]
MSKRVFFNQTGPADVLEIVDWQEPSPQAGEIQVKVHAIGLNRAEIMYRNGQYVIDPVFPAKLGYEASGEVVALGENVAGFHLGDRVAVIPAFMFTEYGTYGETVNLPARAVVKMPDNQSWTEAAATWMQFTTAYGALIEYAGLKEGDFVILNAASSSVGMAAIQIANMVGAVPIAVSRTSSKARQLFDGGAKYVIATSEENLKERILEITDGKGARVAFDPVGGAGATAIIEALSFEGLFYQYGALSPDPIQVPVMDLLGKHLTLRGYELFEITADDGKLARAKAFISKGLASGALKPVIAKEFDFSQVQEAHRFMEKGTQVGKIVLTVK